MTAGFLAGCGRIASGHVIFRNRMALEIVPSIDLRGGRVVRLQQGDYGRQLTYDVDPIETARQFAADGARFLHIVDLDGAQAGKPVQEKLIAEIAIASGLTVQVGGGIRSTADIRRLLGAGISRVVVGTKAIEDWKWFTALLDLREFAGKIILAIDAKDGVIATRGWTHQSTRRAVDVAAEVREFPLAALLYTDVSHDGMLDGPNVAATRALVEAGRVPVIASGGVGRIEHIQSLGGMGIWGVIVGRSLYDRKVNLREAVELATSL